MLAFVLRIIDNSTRKRLDDDLKEFLKNQSKGFTSALDKHTERAISRNVSVCEAIIALREKANENKQITEDLYRIVIADQGWGVRLDKIEFHLRGVGNNKKMIEKIFDRVGHLNSIDENIKEMRGVFLSTYGKRRDDIIDK